MKITDIFFLNKRHKIIIASVILSLGLLSTQLVPFYLTYHFITGLAVLVFIMSVWALWEGLNKSKAIILSVLPVLFTIAIASFYYLLPGRWLTRIPVAVGFGLIMYTLFLSQNVFNVASIRTIPLYRVASTTIFVLTLITAFLLFTVIFSLNLFFAYNGLIIFLLSVPLILQFVWSIQMGSLNLFMIVFSIILSFIMGEVAIALSFWPMNKLMQAIVLSAFLYAILGISTLNLRERLTKTDIWIFAGFGSLIFIIAAIFTSWNG